MPTTALPLRSSLISCGRTSRRCWPRRGAFLARTRTDAERFRPHRSETPGLMKRPSGRPDTMAIETMRRRDLLNTCAAAPLALAAGRRAFGQYRYESTWESVDQRPSPAWYTDSKFGIFIHWGVYSVPAYAPVKSKGETMYAER